MIKEWDVTFEQVNQQIIRVDARTRDSAVLKAKREWLENNEPKIIEVVMLDETS